MKIEKKNIFKILILIILFIGLIVLANRIYQQLQENRFKEILKTNDSMNYKLTEIVNGEETNVIVRDNTLLSEEGDTKIWVSEDEGKRVIFDDKYKTAVIDENDGTLEINSLNYTFIKNYFENSNQRFSYGGKENGFYELRFKEKGSKKITILYLNEKTNIIEKMVQNAGNFEFITDFKVEKNKVKKEEIAFPNLEGYRAADSVNSNPSD